MRVLIVRIGAMGDVLHAMPAVAALRAAQPEWFIGWAVEPRWSGLLQIAGDPEDLLQGGRTSAPAMVDRWYRCAAKEWRVRPLGRATRREIASLRTALRAERFDVCVDLQGSLKSAAVGRLAGATMLVGPEEPREWIARPLYRERVELTARHVVDQGCQLLSAAVGQKLRPARVTLPMESAAEEWADEVVGRERFCLIAAGGGWGAKIWPLERMGRVAAELGRRAGLLSIVSAPARLPAGQPADDALAVVRASEGYARALPCTVSQLIALARRAEIAIGGDTGPMHLAAALERPTVGIYGPTDPSRNGPYGARDRIRVLRDESSVTSHKRVRQTEEGMLRIGAEDVVSAAMDLLKLGHAAEADSCGRGQT